MKATQHNRSLTGLKFIFIMFIVLTHTLPDTPLIQSIPFTSFIDVYGGVWGNSLFFTLSGYLLSMGYRERVRSHTISFGTYLYKRLAKLYPMYILSNIVMIPFLIHRYGPSVLSLKRIALVVLMQAGGALDNQFPFNGSSWFVCTLMVCYVLYYFVAYHSKNDTQYRCFLAAGIIIGYIISNYHLDISYLYNENGVGYVNFFTGCALTEIIPRIPEETYKKLTLPAIVMLLLSGYSMLRIGVEAALGSGPLGYTFFLNPLLIFVATVPNIVNRILGSRPIAYLGEISMSIYFCHTPLGDLFMYLSEIITGSEIFTDKVFFLYMIALFPVSILNHYLFNRKKNQ